MRRAPRDIVRRRIRYGAADMIELLTNLEMAEADRLTIAGGMAGIGLMENAGMAVAEAVAARRGPGSRVVVVAGPGNNGGDGFVAARLLAERGYTRGRDAGRGIAPASRAMPRWRQRVERAIGAAEPACSTGADIVVDALFGAGLDRPVEGRRAT